jgi:hypothetical protein
VGAGPVGGPRCPGLYGSCLCDGQPACEWRRSNYRGGEKSTFVFNAVEQPDGSVTGHLVYQFRSGDFGFIMDIDCLPISGSGVQAVLSGVVTHPIGGEPPPYIFVGAPATFGVRDNGEGEGDPADFISDVFFGGGDCNEFRPVVYLPMRGNIQVSQ